jgi:S-adenosylmethionine decarboxylase proenzyme
LKKNIALVPPRPNAQHILLDVVFKEFSLALNTITFWKRLGRKALRTGNFRILDEGFFKFKPAGVSGFWLLSESHLAFHTWPEKRYVALDLFTCGDEKRTKKTLEFLVRELKTLGGEVSKNQKIRRGFIYQPH